MPSLDVVYSSFISDSGICTSASLDRISALWAQNKAEWICHIKRHNPMEQRCYKPFCVCSRKLMQMALTPLTWAFFSLRSSTFCSSFLCFLVRGFFEETFVSVTFFFLALLDGRTSALLSSTPFSTSNRDTSVLMEVKDLKHQRENRSGLCIYLAVRPQCQSSLYPLLAEPHSAVSPSSCVSSSVSPL